MLIHKVNKSLLMAKVYVIGATGTVGSQVTKALLEKGVPTTVLVRDLSKAVKVFGEAEGLNVVQGDYTDYTSFKNTISGHERLFLLINDFTNMAKIKISYAKIAYEAGVKQIVDISSGSVSGAWRQNFGSTANYVTEETLFNLANRGAYVALRPTGFFSNHLLSDDKTVRFQGAILGSSHPDLKKPLISPTDIAQVAVNILTDSIDKHGDSVYDMTSVLLSGNERAEILSQVLGKDIKYIQISAGDEYKMFVEYAQMSHIVAYGLVDASYKSFDANIGLPILLGRPTESLQTWIEANKDKFN